MAATQLSKFINFNPEFYQTRLWITRIYSIHKLNGCIYNFSNFIDLDCRKKTKNYFERINIQYSKFYKIGLLNWKIFSTQALSRLSNFIHLIWWMFIRLTWIITDVVDMNFRSVGWTNLKNNKFELIRFGCQKFKKKSQVLSDVAASNSKSLTLILIENDCQKTKKKINHH